MKNTSFTFILFLLLIITGAFSLLPKEGPARPNTLTRNEKKAGWQLLFDGKTFNGWRGLGRDHVPEGLWIVRDGQIMKLKSSEMKQLPDGRPVENGDLMTVATFENFELTFEWKIEKAGNSGLKYNVSEQMCQENGSKYSALGFEYQMLDDADPVYRNLKPAQFSGSLYDLVAAKDIRLKPVGEYNLSRIVVNGTHAEHWLNGIRVVEYEFGSRELEAAYKSSKFNKIAGFIGKRSGHIVLQNHSDAAWFRNIKIRIL